MFSSDKKTGTDEPFRSVSLQLKSAVERSEVGAVKTFFRPDRGIRYWNRQ